MIHHVAIYYWYSYIVEYILNSILNAVVSIHLHADLNF